MLKEFALLTEYDLCQEHDIMRLQGTGKATLTGSKPQVVRINLLDDAKRPVGELEVEVDPHGADFQPTTAGTGQACVMWWTLACLIAHGSLAVGWHGSRLCMLSIKN